VSLVKPDITGNLIKLNRIDMTVIFVFFRKWYYFVWAIHKTKCSNIGIDADCTGWHLLGGWHHRGSTFLRSIFETEGQNRSRIQKRNKIGHYLFGDSCSLWNIWEMSQKMVVILKIYTLAFFTPGVKNPSAATVLKSMILWNAKMISSNYVFKCHVCSFKYI